MHKPYRSAWIVGDSTRAAVASTIEEWSADLIRQEPAITERLATRIADNINGRSANNVSFSGMSIPDRSPGSLERRLGADLAGVLNISVPGYSSQKLFLAQGKIAPGRRLDRNSLHDLELQCKRMLRVTSHSVVLLYHEGGVDVVRAIDAQKSARAALMRGRGGIDADKLLYRKRLDQYLLEVYTTWQGDEKLGSTVRNIRDLERVVEENRARLGLAIIAVSERRPRSSTLQG